MTAALNHLTSIQYDQHLECQSAVINMSASPLHLFFGRKEKKQTRKHAVNHLIQYLSFPYDTETSQMAKNFLFMDQLLKQTLQIRSPTGMEV